MFSADMTGAGGSLELYPEPDDQGDVIDHPAHNLPMPMQPRAPQGTQMAGDVVRMPTDAVKTFLGHTGDILNKSSARTSSDRTNVTPIKKP